MENEENTKRPGGFGLLDESMPALDVVPRLPQCKQPLADAGALHALSDVTKR